MKRFSRMTAFIMSCVMFVGAMTFATVYRNKTEAPQSANAYAEVVEASRF